jgi:hypothetical protein
MNKDYENRSKIVSIYRKLDGLFTSINRAVTQEGNQYIGTSITAKRTMMLQEEEMRSYMPQLIGVQPGNLEFVLRLNKYWDTLAIFVPEHGMPLEIGIYYRFDDESRSKAIKAFMTKHSLKADDITAFADKVEEEVPHEKRWMYGNPINTRDYALWRYCLNYSHVANNPELVHKSNKIRFYIHDEDSARKASAEMFKLRTQATAKFMSIINKPDEVDSLLYMFGMGDAIAGKSDGEKGQLLENIRNSKPKEFIMAVDDTSRKDVAYVEKLIALHILHRNPNNGMISEPASGDVLGSTPKEVIAFLAKPENARFANELKLSVKHT